jgi:hypothetical protein
MPISNYLANAMINATVRNTAYSSPANVWVGLYSTAPTASTAGTELSGNGYSRQNVTFSAPSGGVANSNVSVTFSATGNAWQPAVATAILDKSTAGNILWFSTITTQVVLASGNITLTSGNITLSVS